LPTPRVGAEINAQAAAPRPRLFIADLLDQLVGIRTGVDHEASLPVRFQRQVQAQDVDPGLAEQAPERTLHLLVHQRLNAGKQASRAPGPHAPPDNVPQPG
jgi:hypothetical protein